jgi:hypothetical protein
MTHLSAMAPASNSPVHNRLNVYGCSVRNPAQLGSVHLVKYEEALDGRTGPHTSRPDILL